MQNTIINENWKALIKPNKLNIENSDDKTSLIYYRAQVEDGSSVTAGQFYEFDTIPFERLADESSRIMIKRYIVERELNAFGIFVGKESEGKVEAITKTNNNL